MCEPHLVITQGTFSHFSMFFCDYIDRSDTMEKLLELIVAATA